MLLALETASEVGGLALLEGDGVLGERVLGSDLGSSPHHAAQILTALDELLRELGRSEGDVRAIALSVGPGSFTGLRIGLATALGLCFGTERLLVPVPTLAALALEAAPSGPLVPMLDARKGQVYTGLYDREGRALLEDRVVDPLAWLNELARHERAGSLVFLGPGARLFHNEIRSVLGPDARVLPIEAGQPSAARVGRLGARLRQAGGARPPREVSLVYLRPAEAEEKRLQKRPSGAGHATGEPIS